MSKVKRYKIYLPDGQSIWITGNSISEAFLNGWEKYSDKRVNDKHIVTVKEFIEDTYKPTFYPTLKPLTKKNYDYYFRMNIIPFLGSYQMDAVKVDTIQKFYNWMANAAERGRKKNINKNTIKRVRGLLSRVFKVAVEMGIIAESPIKNTLLRIKAEDGGHHNAIDDDIIARIKHEIPTLANEDERLYMTLLVFMGLRPEEVYGLQWSDLHLDNYYGQIQRAVTYPDKSKAYVDTTKTEFSARTFLITSKPREILKASQKESGFILGGETPWCYSRTQRVKRRAFTHLGIRGYCTPYDFRTTFATQAKERGQTSAQVADLLGHKDTRMVETIYARTRHQSVMKQLEVIERLNG